MITVMGDHSNDLQNMRVGQRLFIGDQEYVVQYADTSVPPHHMLNTHQQGQMMDYGPMSPVPYDHYSGDFSPPQHQHMLDPIDTFMEEPAASGVLLNVSHRQMLSPHQPPILSPNVSHQPMLSPSGVQLPLVPANAVQHSMMTSNVSQDQMMYNVPQHMSNVPQQHMPQESMMYSNVPQHSMMSSQRQMMSSSVPQQQMMSSSVPQQQMMSCKVAQQSMASEQQIRSSNVVHRPTNVARKPSPMPVMSVKILEEPPVTTAASITGQNAVRNVIDKPEEVSEPQASDSQPQSQSTQPQSESSGNRAKNVIEYKSGKKKKKLERKSAEKKDFKDPKEVALSKAAEKSSEEAQRRLATPAGWNQMNSWLKKAEKESNFDQVLTLLLQIMDLPLTVDLLKQNDTAKIIRKLSQKCTNKDVRNTACDLVDLWKSDLIKQQGTVEKKEEKQRHSIDSNLEKEDISDDSCSNGNKEQIVESSGNLFEKFEKILPDTKPVEVKKTRPRTVKVAPHKFRSTGLEIDPNDPPAAKKHKPQQTASKPQVSTPVLNTKTTPYVLKQEEKPVESKPKLEEGKAKPIDIKSKLEEMKADFKPKLEEAKPDIKPKLEEAKPDIKPKLEEAKPDIKPKSEEAKTKLESKPKVEIKQKTEIKHKPAENKPRSASFSSPSDTKPKSESKHKPNTTSPATSPAAPPKPKPAPPPRKVKIIESDFFMNALDSNAAQKVVKRKKVPKVLPKTVPTARISTDNVSRTSSDDISPESTPKSDQQSGSYSPTVAPSKSNRRRVRFADSDGLPLFEIKVFEMDESERANVSKTGTTDMKHAEMQNERLVLDQAKRNQQLHLGDTSVETYFPWKLATLENYCLIEDGPGSKSTENEKQKEREAGVLQAIYLTKEQVPDYPQEPDSLERGNKEEPIIMPLEEVPEAKGDETAAGGLLPPELAMLMSNLNKSGMMPVQTPAPSAPGNSQQMMHNVLQAINKPATSAPTSGPPPNPFGQSFPPGLMPPFPMPGMVPPRMPMGMRGQHRGGPPRGMRGRGGAGLLQIRNLRPAAPRSCPYFESGKCTFGDSCRFKHGTGPGPADITRQQPSAPPVGRDNKPPMRGNIPYRRPPYRQDKDYRGGPNRYNAGQDTDFRYRRRSPQEYRRSTRRRSRSPEYRGRRRSRSRSKSRSRSRSHSRSRSRSASKSPSRSNSSRSDSKSPSLRQKDQEDSVSSTPSEMVDTPASPPLADL